MSKKEGKSLLNKKQVRSVGVHVARVQINGRIVKRRILLLTVLKLKRPFLGCVSRIKVNLYKKFFSNKLLCREYQYGFLLVSVSSLMADGPHFTYFPTLISLPESVLPQFSGTDNGDSGNEIVPTQERSFDETSVIFLFFIFFK